MGNQYYKYEGTEIIQGQYTNDQYEEFYNDKLGYQLGVEARYIPQKVDDYQDNQLIEALPPILSMVEFVNKVEKEPTIDERERLYEYTERIHSIAKLEDFFHVFAYHIKAEIQLGVIIRRGYTSKLITSNEFKKNLLVTSNFLNDKTKSDVFEQLKCLSYGTSSKNSGFSIYGPSGGGKTTTIDTILKKCYPQYIIHSNYKGNKTLFRQLVWIKIECSHNGSIKGICKKFFEAVDKVIGSNYMFNFTKKERTIDDMIAGMAHVAQIHGLGALIIDELQHIIQAKSGKQEVMNFLVTLQNEIKLPIVFIGTYKLINELLTLDYRQARRASGIGEIEIGYFKEKEQIVEGEIDEWSDFVEELWKYQWTKKKVELTPKIKKTLFEESIGIIDRAIKLFMISQINAILLGSEEITIKSIKRASNEELKLSKKMMDAYKKGEISELKKYGDLDNFDFKGFVVNSVSKVEEIQAQKELGKYKESENYKTVKANKELVTRISNFLKQAGIKTEISVEIAKDVIKKEGANTAETVLNQKAMRDALKRITDNRNEKSTPKKVTTNKDKKEDSNSNYIDYRENGKIKPPEADFSEED